MKIFGIECTTKKELRQMVSELYDELEACEDELNYKLNMFPFDLGQVVYDVALKNNKGRYTKTKPSFEHSTITEVTVDEKNYFSLVNRLRRNDVFFDYDSAEEYLKSICK
jgi:light-regulated signal transduction histidine kinase (bacteriophytochrome)